MEWLLYPAYPRHSFSLRGLVHICIPHTGTPCGRGLYRQGLTRLSWVLPSASALLPSLCLYYSTLLAVCQEVFATFFSVDFHLSSCCRGLEPFGSCLAEQQPPHGIGLLVRCPLELLFFVPLLYHTLEVLSRGFCKLFIHTVTFSFGDSADLLGYSPGSLLLPLDTSIVSQLGRFVKRFFEVRFSGSFYSHTHKALAKSFAWQQVPTRDWFVSSSPLDTLIVSQLGGICQGVS